MTGTHMLGAQAAVQKISACLNIQSKNRVPPPHPLMSSTFTPTQRVKAIDISKRAEMPIAATVSDLVTPGPLKSALGLALGAFFIPLTQAQTMTVSADIGYARYLYQEPGLMQLSGTQYVVGGRMLVEFDSGYALIAEGRYVGNDVDYASPRSGSSNGQPLSIQEFRMLAGSTYQWRDMEFRPFTGLGLRRLINDSHGLITTNGNSGYLRVSTYKYLPVGVNVDVRRSIGIKIEYDHLLDGHQDSHILGELIKNRQSQGYGYRFSVSVANGNWLTEPYYQRWNIATSNVVSCLGGFHLCREPENFTTEVGVNISYLF